MSDFKEDNYELLHKVSDIMYSYFGGQKKTHSELDEQTEPIITLLTKEHSDDHNFVQLVKKYAIEIYEMEVGLKTYEPNIIDKKKESSFWLYREKQKTNHAFFDRYKLYLKRDGFPNKAVENIESICEKTLSRCANPQSKSEREQKRGLVVGDVQSGKTANYLGLINMAYDYGYKIVVLLAGNTTSLRLQTQKRTDKGVIGADSNTIGNVVDYCGVGLFNEEYYVIPFTNRSNDFKRFILKNTNAGFSDYNKPVVLVVKKVKSILESVSEKLLAALDEKGLESKSILIVDDEADNASLNTSSNADKPSTINKLIREIFNKFPIASYVGYTATPFANILSNPFDKDVSFLDLFPADFIIQLNAPDSYFGGRKVFPQNYDPDVDELPLCLRRISEDEPLFLPVIHEKQTRFPGLCGSLKEAIQGFIIDNVIRTLRGDGTKHRSMMINITRFNLVQDQIREAVEEYISLLTNEIEQLSSYETSRFIQNKDMREIYDLFHTPFYSRFTQEENGNLNWDSVQAGLYDEIKQFHIAVINSTNGRMSQVNSSGRKERFDYEQYEGTGARVIAIGGMVLSRGLTLEGLMVSYYSRNAATYDTLLQMCRWFGYRPGYEDLCRIYLSQLNIDRFDAVLTATEDLKIQFAEMERNGKKPKDFGLMIRECPDNLETSMLVTARNKMRGSEQIECHLNYGGVYADTSKIKRDEAVNSHNLELTKRLLSNLNFRWENGRYFMATCVPKKDVAAFIKELRIPYVNKKFDVEGLSAYIEQSTIFDVWDIVLASGDGFDLAFSLGVQDCKAAMRSFHINGISDQYVRIGGANNRVLDPSTFNAGLWLSKEKQDFILEEKRKTDPTKIYSNLTASDYLKYRDNPILVIYPIELKTALSAQEKEKGEAYPGEYAQIEREKEAIAQLFGEKTPVMAYAIGFPYREEKVMVTYRANLVKLDELTKGLELNDDGEGEGESEDD